MSTLKTLDAWVGFFVAAGIVALFFLGMKVSNLTSFGDEAGYTITAKFTNSGGLKVRSPVSVAGVRIGRVQSITFDHDTYESIVTMLIDPPYKTLPDDTAASIFTAGLLGEQYISLEPGGSDDFLKQDSEIDLTEPALVLEKLIGQFLFDSKDKKSEE